MSPLKGVVYVVAALLGLVWITWNVELGTALPDHAILLANTGTQTYVTVPCVIRGDVEQPYVANVEAVVAGTEEAWYEALVEPMTKAAVRSRGYQADRRCGDAGGFISTAPWIPVLLGNAPERVDADGTVLW